MQTTRHSVISITISGADCLRVNHVCPRFGRIWNQAVDGIDQQEIHNHQSKYDVQRFPTALAIEDRVLHASANKIIAHDDGEAIKTSRSNPINGMKVRSQWRKNSRRTLPFSSGYGRRILKGKLDFSLGRNLSQIDLAIPAVLDSGSYQAVLTDLSSEIQLGWHKDFRCFSLHIPYQTEVSLSPDDAVTLIDLGTISPMAMVA